MAKKTKKNYRSKTSKLKSHDAIRLKTKPSIVPRQVKSKPILKQNRKILNVYQISSKAFKIIWTNKKLFFGIAAIYGILNLILVQGLASSTDVTNLKSQLDKVFSGQYKTILSSLSIFATLVGSAGNGSSQLAGAYQFFLGLITSLAVIWALRQVIAGRIIRIRDAFYNGMSPLIPFILILIVIGLQLLPILIGSTLYGIVLSNNIATNLIEQILFLLIFILFCCITFYLISSSIFALYIVSLPDMTPKKALKVARKLVKNRRIIIVRKIIALPIILLILAAIIMIPIIIWLSFLAQWIFFILTMFSLIVIHSYMYTLYRELLDD